MSDSDPDSLFAYAESGPDCSEDGEQADETQEALVAPVRAGVVAPIPGLHLFPELIPQDTATQLIQEIILTNIFHSGNLNQVMLFTSARTQSSYLPAFLADLIQLLERDLKGTLSEEVHSMCFDPLSPHQIRSEISGDLEMNEESDGTPSPLARQIILNLYTPSDTPNSFFPSSAIHSASRLGITPHIDLPHRYADGIVGVSLGWGEGVVMDFERDVPRGESEKGDEVDRSGRSGDVVMERGKGDSNGEKEEDTHSIWIPNNSVYILSGPARWEWKHGIAEREYDILSEPPLPSKFSSSQASSSQTTEDQQDLEKEDGGGESAWKERRVERDVRISITLRWLKAGGDVLTVPAD